MKDNETMPKRRHDRERELSKAVPMNITSLIKTRLKSSIDSGVSILEVRCNA